MHWQKAGRCSGSTPFCARCCARAPTSSSTARTCPAASWSPNMSTSPTPSSRRTRPAWSMPCSTRSRGNSVPTSFRVASAPASGEDSLIARYFKPIATDPGAFSLDDDAAVLKAQGADIVVTTDAIVEGVHFLPDDPPDSVARKALRVNLSDLAAKGVTPAGFVLTLALRAADESWLEPFARALGEDARSFDCPLRSGAKPGDRIMVTGTIGDAALGLDVLRNGAVARALAGDPKGSDMLVARYR